jgi:hypothetical protein
MEFIVASMFCGFHILLADLNFDSYLFLAGFYHDLHPLLDSVYGGEHRPMPFLDLRLL